MIGRLRKQAFVKHVIPQRRFINPLKEFEKEEEEEDKGYEGGNEGSGSPLKEHEREGGNNEGGPLSIYHPENSTVQGRYHKWYSEAEASLDGLHLPGTRKLHSSVFQVTDLFGAHSLWEKHTGAGVNVAIFDTGLRKEHPHFRNVIAITNWTDEESTEDGLGHGTIVAGMW